MPSATTSPYYNSTPTTPGPVSSDTGGASQPTPADEQPQLDPSEVQSLQKVELPDPPAAEQSDATVVMTTPVPELVEELADQIVVVREGRIAAYDTAEGLRRQTGCEGPLAEVLERLIHPHTLSNIQQYFEGPPE